MERTERIALLEQVRSGALSPAEAEALLAPPAFEDLGYAKVDHHRASRQGAAEVIFGQGKEPDQIEGIVRSMADRGAENILITRLSGEKEAALRGKFPYDYSAAACLAVAHPAPHPLTGAVAVVSAGTSDLAVCEEAALTAEALGSREGARCIVAVAGMEGALPSVVGGLVSAPVIAVPTSVGYGANLGGLAALLAMLNSCASGVSVVNIDNGFGAGFLAHRINQMKGVGET